MARIKEMFFAYLYSKNLDLISLDFNLNTLCSFILKLKNADSITIKRKNESLFLLKLTFLQKKIIVCLG